VLSISGKKANSLPTAELARLQAQLEQAALASMASGELPATITKGLLQLQRYMTRDIEVDTGRTKQSLFVQVKTKPDGVVGAVMSNVKYSPWVRDAGHQRHFMVQAAQREGPRVLAEMGREYVLNVAAAFK
jgi:hypothetical protein